MNVRAGVAKAGRVMCWLVALLLGVSAASAEEQRAEIAVIAHVDFAGEAIGAAELASIFRRTEVVDVRGQPMVPVNLPGTHGLRVAFSRALFGLEPGDMEAYWNERYFHGVAPPHVVASVEAMLRFVAATAGAIGYVPACAVDARVKVVARLAASQAERAAFACAPAGEVIPNLQTEIAH